MTGEAAHEWLQIATAEGVESRHALQAWHFLRQAGDPAPPAHAKTVLGVAIEMPAGGSHDLLAGYSDGSVRLLGHSGAVAIGDESPADLRSALARWLEAGATIARVIGPWEASTFPPLGPGDVRVTVLTPSDPHFGQGPAADLSSDPDGWRVHHRGDLGVRGVDRPSRTVSPPGRGSGPGARSRRGGSASGR